MPPSTAEVRPELPGGTCPILPIQCCIVWASRQEKIISPLAFRVYFAAHEVKFWRSKNKQGETYHYEPYGFQLSDISRLLPGVPEAKIAKAFNELETINVLNLTDRGIWFAENLDDTTLTERIKQRALTMFNQLHENTRDKIVKIPRRILKIIVQCGRRIVRAATLIGMLLTTMLTKHTDRYSGYKGCVKAEWIGKVFGVNAKRVNSERAKLINEGWFTREPTTPRVRKKWGEWVRLNLTPAQPTPNSEPPTSEPISEVSVIDEPDTSELTIEEPLDEMSIVEIPLANEFTVEESLLELPIIEEPNTEECAWEELVSETSTYEEADIELPTSMLTTKRQPQNQDFEQEVQPLLNLSLSSSEEILNNQTLSSEEPNPGVYQTKNPGNPTWIDIQPIDLKNDIRSEKLWEDAIKLGHLKPTHANRINFFAAIAHALRVAKNNACGLLRTIVEKGLWHFLTQADEYNAIQRLRRFTESQQINSTQQVHVNPFFATNNERVGDSYEQEFELSEDALIVQTLTADLKRAGVVGDIFRIVKQNGYLQDWDKERWLQAEQELAQAQMLWARQRCQGMDMTSVGDVIEEGNSDDEASLDRG